MKATHRDPNATPCLGRQPEIRKLTPSNPFPWYDAWEEGHRFSISQEHELIRRGADPVTAPALLVKRQAKHSELYWNFTDLPPRYEMECPIIGRRGDKVKVIAPDGTAKLVAADGWSHRPYRQPRDAWGAPA